MSTEPIRLILADDSERLIEAWERLIAQQPDMKVVGTVAQAEQIEDAVCASNARVVVMDLTMNGRDPLDIVRLLAQCCPAARVVVYSGWSGSDLAERCRAAGAWGVVGKHEPPDVLLSAIRSVAGGQPFFNP